MAIAAAAVIAPVASADAQILFSGDVTASVDVAAPAGITFAPGPLGPVGGLVGGPITVHDTIQQDFLRITVEDCCLVGDVYEVIVNGVSVGTTSEVPIGGPTNSSGVFLIEGPIAPSSTFVIDIWDITLSYIGFDSPFGGGEVPANYSPAGLSVTVESLIPEPASMALLGTALVGFGIAARRRRRQPEKQEAA